MKRFFLLLLIITSFPQIFAQTTQIKKEKVELLALNIARNLWGDVYSDEPFPVYNVKGELVAYRINFAIGFSFPDKKTLAEKSRRIKENNIEKWGGGHYGHITMGARYDVPVIFNYSKALSPVYAEFSKIEKQAEEYMKGPFSIAKIYYLDFEDQWYEVNNGKRKVFIKVFPISEMLTPEEFDRFRQTKKDHTVYGDFSKKWEDYLSGVQKFEKSKVLIPHPENCKFYSWSFGCSPTAAAMLASWWDYNSANSSFKASKLVDYHYMRCINDCDYQVPNVQKELALEMHTDTLTGCTWENNILPGMKSVFNNLNGYSFTFYETRTDSITLFNKVINEISNYKRPVHTDIPGHSECCVGYDSPNELFGVHNTWWPPIDWQYFGRLRHIITVAPGGNSGQHIKLTFPLGDTLYNHDGSGEFFYTKKVQDCNITWETDVKTEGTVKIEYSTNGGYQWNVITESTENDGQYLWQLPSDIDSEKCRVRLLLKDSSGELLGADGSTGNFTITNKLQTLKNNTPVLVGNSKYFKVSTNMIPDLYVVGARSTTDWDLELYNDSVLLKKTENPSALVDFILWDACLPNDTGCLKAICRSSVKPARLEYSVNENNFTKGFSKIYDWTGPSVVRVFEICLTNTGIYGFNLDILEGDLDLDMALFPTEMKSNGEKSKTNYFNRDEYLEISANVGTGVNEQFYYTKTGLSAFYALVVWSNNGNSGKYRLTFEKAGYWKGVENNYWNNANNWSAGYLPDKDLDVIISRNAGPCWVKNGNAVCRKLIIQGDYTKGGQLVLFDKSLMVHGDLDINSTLEINSPDGTISVLGDVNVNPGAAIVMVDGADISVYGDWDFNKDCKVNLISGDVIFTGSDDSWIRCLDSASGFNNLYITKEGASTTFSTQSTYDLMVNGQIFISSGAKFGSNSDRDIVLKGGFSNYGTFDLAQNSGALVFNGTDQNINMYNASGTFGTLIFNSENSVLITDNITVDGDIIINRGKFLPLSHVITLTGDWINNVGVAAFNETGSKVVFNGGAGKFQSVSTERFDTVEITNYSMVKPLAGSPRIIVFNNYDWTSGGIAVTENGGYFKIYNLLDNGIYGTFKVYPGSELELYNMDGYVDLNGKVYLYGGKMTVYGGTAISWWPYDNNAKIHMEDGILDFKNRGIFVKNKPPYILKTEITGGTIRTSQGFICERSDFKPAGGTIELYGSEDFYVRQFNGCEFYNLKINKGSKEQVDNAEFHKDLRSKEFDFKGEKDNMINAETDLVIKNELFLEGGLFRTQGHNIFVGNVRKIE
jgi:hypothetical protein